MARQPKFPAFEAQLISDRNWFCAQIGAREHYSIPRALSARGALGYLMTDYWSGPLTKTFAKLVSTNSTKSLASRFSSDIDEEHIKSWNVRSFLWESRARIMARNGGVRGRYLGYCETGKRFANALINTMSELETLPQKSVFFGYDTCSLEVMRYLKQRGVVCLLDQIDPCRVEIEMVKKEQEAWPGWQTYSLEVPNEFYTRHEEEWNVADKIIVNSEFSRDGLVEQGVPRDKISVVPLCYDGHLLSECNELELTQYQKKRETLPFSHRRPLKVLFLGQVMLRKGIQYLVEAARLLRDTPVVFEIVGPLSITEKAIKSAPDNMLFHGRTTGGEIRRWYMNSDIFILPTLSDGFAITQLEAMGHGLPVISTPNCGAVVSDGVDGFLVPPRNPEVIANIINRYLETPELLKTQHVAALKKSKLFTLERLGKDLLTLEKNIRC